MSKRLRGRLLAAIFSLGFAGLAIPASGETLAEAISLAYETNPTLASQRATQRALDESYVQARAGWRPTLTLSATATESEARAPFGLRDVNGDGVVDFNAPDSITRSRGSSAGVSFSQPLWTGGRTAAAVSAVHADILQGRENLRRIEQQVLQAVITSYVDVRRDQEALRIRQENVAVLERQLDESEARFEVGEITRTDVAQSEARLAAARAQLQSAQAQLAVSRAAYASVVGQNPGELAPVPSLAYLLPSDVEQAFDIAERFSPTLRAQQYAEMASRARVAGARAERMPQVSATASATFGGGALDDFDRDLYSRETRAGVTVSIPLFAGGVITSRVRQAIDRNAADRISIETQRRNMLQQVTQGWNQLIASRANIESTAEQVRAASIAAEGTRQEQQVGLRTTIDVLNAEQELRQAQLNQISAFRDEYVAATVVLTAMGRLEAKNLIPEVPQYDPAAHFRKLRVTWGWVPWEEPISVVDRILALPPIPRVEPLPLEPPTPPGLAAQPPSAVVPPVTTP